MQLHDFEGVEHLQNHPKSLIFAGRGVLEMSNSMFNPSQSARLITVQVNGELQSCPSKTRLSVLLEQIGLNLRLVAVEYNGEILHRQFWETTEIQEGDRLEIVTIVGGG